jgi:hypothetical protein
MSLTRRQCIELSTLLLLSSCTHTHTLTTKKTKEKYLITNAPLAGYGNSNEFVVTPPGSIIVYNSESDAISDIQIDFFGHTLLQNPINKNLVYTFGQYGMLGAIIDIDSEKCVRYIKAPEHGTFMGHAGFIEQQNSLYTTEHDHNKHEGYVVFRDPLSLKELTRFKSGGSKPHDTIYLKETHTIVVINAEGPSSLVYIDAKNGKIVNKIFLTDGQFGNYSHFEISTDGWIVALPRKSRSRINLIDPLGNISTIEHPKTTLPGILSARFITNSNYVVVTYPEAGFIQIWNYKTKESVANIKLPNPRGLVQIENELSGASSFLASSGDTNLMALVKIDKNQQVTVSQFHSKFGGKGSHMVSIRT